MAASNSNPELALSDTASLPEDQPVSVPKTSSASQFAHGPMTPEHSSEDETTAANAPLKSKIDAKSKICDLLKDRMAEWTSVAERKGPLTLLNLPLDILKEIVKEVTHTNDLTALALTHSALHNLAIPHIYSRFDIVWPDAHATTEPRTGVDALTYGLATLCMGEVFKVPTQEQSFICTNCGTENIAECHHGHPVAPRLGQRRLGNQYPQFTRKFSLGNGPADWVSEYLIIKEAGKMLGTLVALAVQRMTNLETFVWDMPTGVLGDVWMALASLRGQHCRLERVWVRWHDNSETMAPMSHVSSTPAHGATSIGWNVPPGSIPSSNTVPHALPYAHSRVEYPTLSVLPPLRSLSVLDIDELDYLDEMSCLIAKSKDRLRELRVGISEKAYKRDFAMAWDGPDLHQVDHNAAWPGASTIGEKRLGGVLGVLLGRMFDIRKKQKCKTEKRERTPSSATSPPITQQTQPFASHITVPVDIQSGDGTQEYVPETGESTGDATWDAKHESTSNDGIILNPGVTFGLDGDPLLNSPTTFDLNCQMPLPSIDHIPQTSEENLIAQTSATQTTPGVDEIIDNAVDPQAASIELPLRRSQTHGRKGSHFSEVPSSERQRLDGKLRLQTLELERVPLSVTVLQKAFDWSILTNLTILDCAQHDKLWVSLRRHFQPSTTNVNTSSAKHASNSSMQYHLHLKKIHTDAASPALISFLKETLAPNTLEVLFLQDRKRSAGTTVTIDAIYRGPLKRHRGSLKKLMLDSSNGIPKNPSSAVENTRWRAWMPNRDVLNFITSGRMSSLRELGIAIDYKDWHHFLQRLPQVPQLRSLNIPFIADHVTLAFEPREIAMQVVDVIVLRPEVELCYIGISHKCFEILENRPHEDGHGSADHHSSLANEGPGGTVTDDEDASDEEGSDEEDEEEDDDDDNGTAIAAQIDPDETESEVSDHDDSDNDSYDGSEDGRLKVRLRLREILFYDDKVAIFKARHGKL